jgi:hypothetical protein
MADYLLYRLGNPPFTLINGWICRLTSNVSDHARYSSMIVKLVKTEYLRIERKSGFLT